MYEHESQNRSDHIAIIGVAGRFPGAENLNQFWQNLCQGVESIESFSDEELLASGVDPALLSSPNYVKSKGTLKDPDLFDASFFDISPREAELLDPQHRIFLECAWQALEDAGYDPRACDRRIGVFAGAGLNTYSLFNLYSNRALLERVGLYQAMLGSDKDYLTTRVSYKLNLRGPSVDIQTACSTSLVAVHMACQSLLNGECRMALAGGVSVMFPQKTGYLYLEGMIFSPDGHCRAFDANAQGCVDGSGAGLVVLKTYEDAVADGDHIYAVILGSAINNDGSMKAGYTAPGVEGQTDVICEALAVARVDPRTVGYVEAHGTGTSLGDPIEVSALTKAFGGGGHRKQFCAIGSVKTNIGHLDAAAGIAGLIKTVLALKHRMLPPSLHFNRPNPQIDFEVSPFYVQSKLSEWKAEGVPRRAGVSSFGIGGTNAHVILEEAPPLDPGDETRPWQLLVLSARSSPALEAATANLAAHLKQKPRIKLADVAYTLQTGRRPFKHRRILVCGDVQDAVAALEAMDLRRVFTRIEQHRSSSVIFMFPGQGLQYVNMALDLFQQEPEFKEQVDICCRLLEPDLKTDLRRILYPGPNRLDSAALELNETYITQPALFVIEYALTRLWMRLGLRPEAMIGHSIGEYVAACVAGVFTLEVALSLVAARGRLMRGLPRGVMLAVTLSEKDLLPLLPEEISLAAVNSPSRCVVSGPAAEIEAFRETLAERSVECRPLLTSHAFHSKMMDPILQEFRDAISRVKLNAPTTPFISNLSGTWITTTEATDPEYWAKHLRGTVRFEAGMREMFSLPNGVFLEIGPGRSLSSLARVHPAKRDDHLICSSIRHRDDPQSDVAFLLKTLGQLWLAGIEIDWAAFYAKERRRRVPLPTYPFERVKYWIEPAGESPGIKVSSGSLARRKSLADWFYVPLWKQAVPRSSVTTPGVLHGKLSWLLFVDGCGIGDRLARRLERDGHDVIAVKLGRELKRIGDREYAIAPERGDDYVSLLDELHSSGRLPNRIVYLWTVSEPDRAQGDEGLFQELLDRAFYGLLSVAQTTTRHNGSNPIEITIVSSDMHSVDDGVAIWPEKAALLGACKVIPLEHPNLRCRSIDISLPVPGRQEKKLIDQLILELYAWGPELVTAYRGGKKWVQTFEPIRPGPVGDGSIMLRDGGVYLVTGGLGGIGLALAEYLVHTARAKLVLTGRSVFPERAEWQNWLDGHGDHDPTSRKILKLGALEKAGSEVMVLSGDVADYAQMHAAIGRTRQAFGEINGVIHAAGLPGGGLIQLKTREAAAAILSPKVKGTRVLESLLKDSALDFLILCSSVTSITGAAGQIDYCAANAFLDSFAHYNSATNGIHTISIDWDAWKDVGMAAAASDHVGGDELVWAHPGPDHPLFDGSLEETEERRTLVTEFSPQKHWVLDEHRIVGHPVVPGTVYLEMARAAFENGLEECPVEISDVFFLTPLRVRDGERKKVVTVLEKDGEALRFVMKSKPENGAAGSQKWQEHASGRISHSHSAGSGKVDLAELIKRCSEKKTVGPEEWSIDDGPRWRTFKEVYIGRKEQVAILELPEEFSSDLDCFRLHPALLDVATGIPRQYLGDGSNYLPLSYKLVRITGRLARTIYCYARYKDDEDLSGETMAFDLKIMDEGGFELVDIHDFTAKRVNNAATKIRDWSSAGSDNVEQLQAGRGRLERFTDGDNFENSRERNSGISVSEGVEVFSRILSCIEMPQVIISSRDLQTVIEQARALALASIAVNAEELASSTVASAHPRPSIQSAYVPPRDQTEQQLADIWQELLGITEVGINDDFFELGGDSIVALQTITRANQVGFQITPRDVFQHRTIAELASLGRSGQSAEGTRSALTGKVPLTPVQGVLLARQSAADQPQVEAVLLDAGRELDVETLKAAVQGLLRHHDALALRFEPVEGWQQSYGEAGEDASFPAQSVFELPEQEREVAIDGLIRRLGSSLSISAGPLLYAALLNVSSNRPDHVLLIAHSLVIDSTSWRLLIEDLQTAYDQAGLGKTISLQPRRATFRQGTEQLIKEAKSRSTKAELDYWLSRSRSESSRVLLERQNSPDSPIGRYSLSLSKEDTEALFKEVAPRFHARITEVLLTALIKSFALRNGSRSLVVNVESEWRTGLFKSPDLSRTVGNCTHWYPAFLTLGRSPDPSDELKTIKEQFRRIPNGGTGYSLGLYESEDKEIADGLRAIDQAAVHFRYRGEFDKTPPGTSLRMSVQRVISSACVVGGIREPPVAIDVYVAAGRLRTEWSYNASLMEHRQVETLASNYQEAAKSLIARSRSPEADGVTPSDFPLARLNEQKLKKLAQLIDNADAS